MENRFFGICSNDLNLNGRERTSLDLDSVNSKNIADNLEESLKDENMEALMQTHEPSSLPQSLKHTNIPEIEEGDLVDTEMGTMGGLEVTHGKVFGEKSPEDEETKGLTFKEEMNKEIWNPEEREMEEEYNEEDKEKAGSNSTSIIENYVPNVAEKNRYGIKKNASMNKATDKSNPTAYSRNKSQKQKQGKLPNKQSLSLVNLEDIQSKKQTKKQLKNNHTELINILQSMSNFNWFENYGVSQKNHPTKLFNYNAFWFFVCTNYFPRTAFAHKNNKEFIHQRMNRLKTSLPDVFQRLNKNDFKSEIIEKKEIDEFESLLLNSFSKATKYFLNAYKSNNYVEKITSVRTVNPIYQPEYTPADDEWVMEARRRIYDNFTNLTEQNFLKAGDYNYFENPNLLSKIDLQDLIIFYEKDLYEILTDNEKKLGDLEKKTLDCLGNEDMIHKLNLDVYDSLVDLKIRFPEEDAFINLLEKKQNEEKENVTQISGLESTNGHAGKGGKSLSSYSSLKTKPKHIEEFACHICNDEDYAEDDLIVFCSKCNISVHQKCYGLPILPNHDWVCDLCLTFEEKGKYLRCPFCDKRGGAMKPTRTRADTKIFEHSNPGFHEFLQTYAYPDILKTLPKAKTFVITAQKNQDQEENKIEEDKPDDFYYDFQQLHDDFSQEELEDEPKFPHIWVHITCALFVPELYFIDDITMSGILGLENVSKERFKYDCSACGKKKSGAIVNCEKSNCKKAFHPECARRAKNFLDIRENNFNQFVYHIYCEKHVPLKLKRTIEGIESKMKEDISRFFKSVEKQHSMYLTEMKQQGLERIQTVALSKDQEQKNINLKKKKALSIKEEGNYFLKLIEKYIELYKNVPISINLHKISSEDSSFDSYNITNIGLPKNIVKNEKKLAAEDEIWSVMPYKNLTPEQKFIKYKKLSIQMKKKQALKGTKSSLNHLKNGFGNETSRLASKQIKLQKSNQKKARINKSSRGIAETLTEETPSNEIYCICQRPYDGELMLACENCVTWYHPECVGLPENIDLKSFQWFCNKCRKDMGLTEQDYNVEKNNENSGKLLKKRIKNFEVGKEQKYIPKKKNKT